MIRSLLLSVFLSAGVVAVAEAAAEMPSRELPYRPAEIVTFRAPGLPSSQQVTLEPPSPEKAAAPRAETPGGRLEVGAVRPLPKAAPVEQWAPVAGGYVARLEAASGGAQGLRVQLDVSALASPLEVRVQGADGRIELMTVEPGRFAEAWTPWTDGEAQVIELFGRRPEAVSVAAVLHFTQSPFAKAAAACTVPVACTTNDAALDAAIAQRKKSVVKISFVADGRGFVCTATLINTDKFPEGYLLTANHCVNEPSAANSVTTWWFFENSACDAASGVNPASVQIAGGTQFVFGNFNADSSLLLMVRSPPAGAVYSAWNAARIPAGTAVTSLSHPDGDTARLALGTCASCGSDSSELNLVSRPQRMYGVRFSRGIIQGGSSGSGLFTMSGGNLQLRGILLGSTVANGGMSCTNTNEEGIYGRLEVFYPQIEQYIRTASTAPDDAPNRVADMPLADPTGADAPLEGRPGATLSFDNRRLETPGDVDLFRIVLAAPRVVSAWTTGANLDTIGNILDSRGVIIGSNPDFAANDDEESSHNHFGITRYLPAGTYYVQVGHFDATGTGSYNLRIRADDVEQTNHTALWWNSAEPGWGLNVNHQGNKIFATLFTYDATGPMWLVMSDGNRQPDGTYSGPLYRTTGPAFNASGAGNVSVSQVGEMRLGFTGANNANVTYTVSGVAVSKSLTRQEFGTVANCTWSAFDRSYAFNVQDLWYNPSEPGWGLNLTQQGSTLFATLFTYDTANRGLWLVMSAGALNSTAGNFSGPLYRTSGPVFNASPWVAATATQVGTMTFTPTSGDRGTLTYTFNNATVTKEVQRQVFATLRPKCSNSPGS